MHVRTHSLDTRSLDARPLDARPLDTHLFVVGAPTLLEVGRRRLRELLLRRPPGRAVDDVVEELMAEGATGVLVQVGGVVRVAGSSPSRDGWLTVVAHPRGHFATAVLRLDSGAVATASAPEAGELVAVSVVADRAWEAELLASTALAAAFEGDVDGSCTGAEAAERVLHTAGVPGLLVDASDEARPVGGWTGISAAAHPGLLVSSA